MVRIFRVPRLGRPTVRGRNHDFEHRADDQGCLGTADGGLGAQLIDQPVLTELVYAFGSGVYLGCFDSLQYAGLSRCSFLGPSVMLLVSTMQHRTEVGALTPKISFTRKPCIQMFLNDAHLQPAPKEVECSCLMNKVTTSADLC